MVLPLKRDQISTVHLFPSTPVHLTSVSRSKRKKKTLPKLGISSEQLCSKHLSTLNRTRRLKLLSCVTGHLIIQQLTVFGCYHAEVSINKLVSPSLILLGTQFAGRVLTENGVRAILQREAGKQKGRMNLIMDTGSKQTLVGAQLEQKAECRQTMMIFFFLK